MKNKILKLRINDDFSRALVLYYFQAFIHFSLLFNIYSYYRTMLTFGFFAFLFVWGACYRFIYKAMFEQSYSYWVLNSIVFIYLLKTIFIFTFVEDSFIVLYLSFIQLIFLLSGTYIMFSPLFYPRVQWWEYDFRYRGDLKIRVKIKDKLVDGRLTDLRRGACSVELFEDLVLKDDYEFSTHNESREIALTGNILTKKIVIPGRPIRYGMKLSLNTLEEKEAYAELLKFWKVQKRVKLRSKFSHAKQ